MWLPIALRFIAKHWRVAVILAFLAAVIAAQLYLKHKWIGEGRSEIQMLWDADKIRRAAEIDRLKAEQAQITVKTEVVYRDRIKVVHEKGQTLIQRIPAEIPTDACLLPVGFRVLIDQAAAGAISGTASRPNDAAGAAEAIAWRPWNASAATGRGAIGDRELHARQ